MSSKAGRHLIAARGGRLRARHRIAFVVLTLVIGLGVCVCGERGNRKDLFYEAEKKNMDDTAPPSVFHKSQRSPPLPKTKSHTPACQNGLTVRGGLKDRSASSADGDRRCPPDGRECDGDDWAGAEAMRSFRPPASNG